MVLHLAPSAFNQNPCTQASRGQNSFQRPDVAVVVQAQDDGDMLYCLSCPEGVGGYVSKFRPDEKKNGGEAPWTSPMLRAQWQSEGEEACCLVGKDCHRFDQIDA